MTLRHSTRLALEAHIGEGGVADRAYARAIADMEPALDRLKADADRDRLPLLRLPADSFDLVPIKGAASRLMAEGATDLVVIGGGTTGLAAQALAQLRDFAVPGLGALTGAPRLHALEGADPATLTALLRRLPLTSTRFLAMDAPGGSLSTLAMVMAALETVKRAGFGARAPALFLAVSGPDGALRRLLSAHGATVLDPPPGVDARFAALGLPGLLPAAALGVDVAAVRRGAAETLKAVLTADGPLNAPAAAGAALTLAALREGRATTVLIPFADRLERFTRWWAQLWAGSIAHDGQGIMPVALPASSDLAGFLPLALQGPRNAIFTAITVATEGRGPALDAEHATKAGLPFLAGRPVGDVAAAESEAFLAALTGRGRPVRRIEIETLDESALGALLMHVMLETILMAYALGVDPFGSPALADAEALMGAALASGASS